MTWAVDIQNQLGLDAMTPDSLASIQSAKCEYVILNREDALKTLQAKDEVIRNLGIGDINSIYVTTAIETVNTRHSGLGVLWMGPVKPLLRGIQDVPTAGDNVAIVWVEDEPYYLGILNSQNSVQCNWNAIVMNKNIEKMKTVRGKDGGTGTIDGKELKGIPKNVLYTGLGRLEKPDSEVLDNPTGADFATDTLSSEEYLKAKGSVGDLYIEGKFGNSVRMGSRAGYPNMTISNLRQKADSEFDNANDVLETPMDGGLITFLSNKTIQDNFHYTKPWEPSCNLNNKKHAVVFDTNYASEEPANQMLITTDRLIFDSRQNGMLLSSKDDIEMGSSTKINLRAQNSIVADSTAVYIGKEGEKGEPIVLGQTLVDLLKEILEAIAKLNVSGVIAGFSGPIGSSPTYSTNIAPIIAKLETLLSKNHKIEKNK